MGSRFRGNDDWGAAPLDTCPVSGYGTCFCRYDGWGVAPTQVRRGRGGTPPGRPWVPAFAGTTIGEPAPGFPLSRERRLGSPPLGSRFRGNDGWGSPLRRGPPRTGRDHARSTVGAKVAARAQGPACGESCRVSGQTSAASWLPAGTAPLLRILPGWGSLYRQCTTRHH